MNEDGTYLCEMKEMQKNESKSAQWKLGAAANGGSRKLVEGFQLWGRNGVKMASPLPFLNFLIRHARPGELSSIFFFCKKSFAELCCSLLYFLSKNPIIAYKLKQI